MIDISAECLSAASGQVPTVDGVCSYIMPNTDLDTMFSEQSFIL